MFCFELIEFVVIVRAAGAHKQPLRAAEKCRRVAALDLATMPRTTAALFLFFPPRLITGPPARIAHAEDGQLMWALGRLL